mgnify:CR=1 FL=1
MLGMEIKSQQTKKEDAADIPGLCAFYFRHDFPDVKGTAYACPSEGKEDKIGLWNTVYDESSQSFRHLYMLGPVIKNVDAVPENMQEITIAGGKYAVFETEHSSDKLHLESVYKILCCLRIAHSLDIFVKGLRRREMVFLHVNAVHLRPDPHGIHQRTIHVKYNCFFPV